MVVAVGVGERHLRSPIFVRDANLGPELLQWYQENQRQSLYHAQKAFAAGILEGLQHFAFLPKC